MVYNLTARMHFVIVLTLGICSIFGIFSLSGCGKNLSTIFFHPSVEDRAGTSLAGSLRKPTTIAPSNLTYFQFAMFGDVQVRPENLTSLIRFKADVISRNIDFFVVLGDLTEDGNLDEYTKVKTGLDSVGIPYYVTIGNHDLFQGGESGGWATWQSMFGPATYSVTIANAVKFLFLDTSSGDIGASQFTWLENQLKANTTPFTIVGTHYPVYDGATPMIWRLASTEERYKLTNMLVKYNVTAYVAGHIHGYKENKIGTVSHIIAGSMYNYGLDYGVQGYVLFTYNNGQLTWKKIDL